MINRHVDERYAEEPAKGESRDLTLNNMEPSTTRTIEDRGTGVRRRESGNGRFSQAERNEAIR
jgi:hypothetical protein